MTASSNTPQLSLPTAKMFERYRHKCWSKTSRQELLVVPFDIQILSSGCRCSLSCSLSVYLTCKFGGGPVWQHNIIMSTWAKCFFLVRGPIAKKASENAAHAHPGKPIFGTCSLPYNFRRMKISMFGETDRVRSPRKIPFCKLAAQQ